MGARRPAPTAEHLHPTPSSAAAGAEPSALAGAAATGTGLVDDPPSISVPPANSEEGDRNHKPQAGQPQTQQPPQVSRPDQATNLYPLRSSHQPSSGRHPSRLRFSLTPGSPWKPKHPIQVALDRVLRRERLARLETLEAATPKITVYVGGTLEERSLSMEGGAGGSE